MVPKGSFELFFKRLKGENSPMLYWENRDIYLYFSPFFIIYIFLPCIHSLKTYFPHTYFLLETM